MTRAAERPANRLASETSPYLLQHARNPVDWYPWGPEALQRARAEDRPIFLSVGYSACHWCHVMERECFEDAAIAALMNEHFVNVKVDREERPDVDEIYMKAVQALTGSGGIGAVSAGIAEALVATAFGLFVAIPAVWAFNYLSTRVDGFTVEMDNSASELIDYMAKKTAT